VQPAGAGGAEGAGGGQGIEGVIDLPAVVALLETDHLAAAQVEAGDDFKGIVAPR